MGTEITTKESGAGRPSKLTNEFNLQLQEYLNSYEELGEVIPSVAGASLYCKVNRDSIYAWQLEKPKRVPESVYEEFSVIIKALVSTQEIKLLNGGLSGNMNSTITKLILHKHNYSEKQEIDHSSKDGSMNNELKVTVVRPTKQKSE